MLTKVTFSYEDVEVLRDQAPVIASQVSGIKKVQLRALGCVNNILMAFPAAGLLLNFCF